MSAVGQILSNGAAPFDVIPGVGGVTYRLGWRKLGWRRWTMMGRSLFGVGWAIVFALSNFHNWFWGIHEIAAVVALWSILPLVLPSRAEISIDERRVSWREVGWMKREGGWVARGDILRLRVDAGQHYRAAVKKWIWVHAGEALLVAELANGGEAPLVLGYPHAVVMRVAEALRSKLGQDSAPAGAGDGRAEVVDLSNVPLAARDVLHPPPHCDVVLHQVGDMKTFLYARYTKAGIVGRFITIVVAMLLIADAPSFVLLSLMRMHGGWPPGSVWVIGFEVVWLGLMVFTLRRQWRTMAIVVTPDHLTIAWRGCLGGWERSWARSSIAGVKTEEGSNGNVRLVLVRRAGLPVGVVGGAELTWRWVATELRRALGVGIG